MEEGSEQESACLSRRNVLRASMGMAGAHWLALRSPALLALASAAVHAQREGRSLQVLHPPEAAGLEAIAARIMPTDETPGAHEAGVIHFIDQSLVSFLSPSKPQLLTGLSDLDARADRYRSGVCFAELSDAEQDKVLTEIEDSAFFTLMHYLTVAGMFALPMYGGNREQLGWQLIGFEQRHAWAPPFGYYDAQASGSVLASIAEQGRHSHE